MSISCKHGEALAIAHETARLLVRYSRCQKRLRNIETLIQSVQNGRVHPVFSQTRTDHCRVSSVKPRLFDSDDFRDLRSCLPESLRQFFPDSRKALQQQRPRCSMRIIAMLWTGRPCRRRQCWIQMPSPWCESGMRSSHRSYVLWPDQPSFKADLTFKTPL